MILSVTLTVKFPYGPATVAPEKFALPPGFAPAITSTRPLATVFPFTANVRGTTWFGVGAVRLTCGFSGAVVGAGVGCAATVVKLHWRSNRMPRVSLPQTRTVCSPVFSALRGVIANDHALRSVQPVTSVASMRTPTVEGFTCAVKSAEIRGCGFGLRAPGPGCWLRNGTFPGAGGGAAAARHSQARSKYAPLASLPVTRTVCVPTHSCVRGVTSNADASRRVQPVTLLSSTVTLTVPGLTRCVNS